MRSSVCHFLILFLLYVSVEGAADVFAEGVPHNDEAGHLYQPDSGFAPTAQDGDLYSGELDGEHCKHCCHGHAATIVASLGPPVAGAAGDQQKSGLSVVVARYSRAPPVPPPNA